MKIKGNFFFMNYFNKKKVDRFLLQCREIFYKVDFHFFYAISEDILDLMH